MDMGEDEGDEDVEDEGAGAEEGRLGDASVPEARRKSGNPHKVSSLFPADACSHQECLRKFWIQRRRNAATHCLLDTHRFIICTRRCMSTRHPSGKKISHPGALGACIQHEDI